MSTLFAALALRGYKQHAARGTRQPDIPRSAASIRGGVRIPSLPMLKRDKAQARAATRWPAPDETLVAYVEADRKNILHVYRIKPELIREHFGTEQSVLSSGYRYRQIFEVVQNAADAILEAAEAGEDSGRILVKVTDTHLYVGNTGAPLNKDGVIALLGANSSRKRRNQIGRFGLGFKSLLALGGTIELFSRLVSIRFDPEASQRTIAEELQLPLEESPPGLRMAEVISFENEAQRDDHLAELGSWATTVLRAEIKAEGLEEHLLQELKNFPREFVLFLPVKVSMELELGDGRSRIIHREQDGNTVILHEDDEEERWLVAERDIPLTEAMRKDAGALHGRKDIQEVPLIWAVPLDSSEDSTGKFWAFFPTDTRSRVSGIINAPWKIDFGRSALVPGEFNTSLMKAGAALIVETIPELCSPEDAGRALDAFPRALEPRDEPAAPLVEEMWTLLIGTDVIPDGTAELRRAEELALHPIEDQALVEQWLTLVNDENALTQVIHPTCLKRQRLSRLRELRSRSKQQPSERDLGWWLEAACAATLPDVKACLAFVATLSESTKWEWFFEKAARRAKIVLSDAGNLVAAQDAVIDGATKKVNGIYQVPPELLADSTSRKVLVDLLSIKCLDNEEWERRIRRSVASARDQQGVPKGFAWRSTWGLLRVAPPAVLEKISDLFDQIKIRCRDKRWRYRHQVLLPGGVVSDGELDLAAGLLVDHEVHKADASVLKAIGVSDVPRGGMHAFPPSSAPSEYVSAMRVLYWPHLRRDGPNPHENLIRIIGDFSAPHAWELLGQTSEHLRARISQHFLETLAFSRCRTVTFGHTSRTETYPKVQMVNPAAWSLLKSGVVEAERQLVNVAMLATQREQLRILSAHPFARWLDGIDALVACIPDNDYSTLPARRQTRAAEDERPFWTALSKHCQHDEVAVDACRATYEWMAEAGWYPRVVGTAIGNVDLKECYVTQSSTLAAAAFEADVPAIVLSPRAAAMWVKNGAQGLESQISIETTSKAETPVPLIEVVPEFVEVLADETRDAALVRFVTALALRVAGKAVERPCILEAGELLLDRNQFDRLPWKAEGGQALKGTLGPSAAPVA
jgi:hypothetical protein